MSVRPVATQAAVSAPLLIRAAGSSIGLRRQCACGGSAGFSSRQCNSESYAAGEKNCKWPSTCDGVFVILEPKECVREVMIGMPLKEEKDTSQQFTKGQLVRDDDASMGMCGFGPFSGQHDKMFHVERQNDTALCSGKTELFSIRGGSIAGFFSRHTVKASVAEDLCQERIDILIEVEFYRRGLTLSSRLASRSCSISSRLS